MPDGEVLKIDVDGLLRARVPRLYRILPRWVVRRLERLICQDDLNRLLELNYGKTGSEFCNGVLETLEVKVDCRFPERLPDATHRRVVLASNHPLGGLDGMALISLVQKHFGGQVWFVVNDLLMAVKPLESVFLPVNKFGKQSREAMRGVERAFAGNDPIVVFPAGICSRYRVVSPDGGKAVRDLEWHKMFVSKAIQHHRDIVPIHFDGHNSMDFYKKANLRKALHIPFNLEQILLPREMFRSRGKTFTVTIGDMIPYTELGAESGAADMAQVICEKVYMLRYLQTCVD